MSLPCSQMHLQNLRQYLVHGHHSKYPPFDFILTTTDRGQAFVLSSSLAGTLSQSCSYLVSPAFRFHLPRLFAMLLLTVIFQTPQSDIILLMLAHNRAIGDKFQTSLYSTDSDTLVVQEALHHLVPLVCPFPQNPTF